MRFLGSTSDHFMLYADFNVEFDRQMNTTNKHERFDYRKIANIPLTMNWDNEEPIIMVEYENRPEERVDDDRQLLQDLDEIMNN